MQVVMPYVFLIVIIQPNLVYPYQYLVYHLVLVEFHYIVTKLLRQDFFVLGHIFTIPYMAGEGAGWLGG